MDGWKTIVSFWGPTHFQGRSVSFGEGNLAGHLNDLGSKTLQETANLKTTVKLTWGRADPDRL